jgi:hypothetical protein
VLAGIIHLAHDRPLQGELYGIGHHTDAAAFYMQSLQAAVCLQPGVLSSPTEHLTAKHAYQIAQQLFEPLLHDVQATNSVATVVPEATSACAKRVSAADAVVLKDSLQLDAAAESTDRHTWTMNEVISIVLPQHTSDQTPFTPLATSTAAAARAAQQLYSPTAANLQQQRISLDSFVYRMMLVWFRLHGSDRGWSADSAGDWGVSPSSSMLKRIQHSSSAAAITTLSRTSLHNYQRCKSAATAAMTLHSRPLTAPAMSGQYRRSSAAAESSSNGIGSSCRDIRCNTAGTVSTDVHSVASAASWQTVAVQQAATATCSASSTAAGDDDRWLLKQPSKQQPQQQPQQQQSPVAEVRYRRAFDRRLLCTRSGEEMSFEEARAAYRVTRHNRVLTVMCKVSSTGQVRTLRLAPAHTIGHVRECLQGKFQQQQHVDACAVVYEGRALSDSATVEDSGIRHNATLMLTASNSSSLSSSSMNSTKRRTASSATVGASSAAAASATRTSRQFTNASAAGVLQESTRRTPSAVILGWGRIRPAPAAAPRCNYKDYKYRG